MPVIPRRALFAGLAALFALVAAALVTLTSTARAADPRDSFVTRCGIHFCLDGKPYYFAGANTYDVFTFGFDWLPAPDYVDKAKIDAHMARLQNDGVSALRLWNENTTGTTLRAWVDEMGALVKSLDPNHLLGTGMEGQQTSYGYGGDAGNPFVYIHQSPYIDFTSAHMYPTEGWAGLDFTKARALLRRWISDSHDVVGKPFVLGEWNASADRTEWWRQIYAEMEASGGDGDAFWWYPASSSCGGYDSGEGCAEHAVFRTHSAAMKAKSGVADPSSSPSRSVSASPSRSVSASPSRSASASPSASASSPTPGGPASCRVAYKVDNSWPNGFNASVTVTNTGSAAVNPWVLTWTAAAGQGLVNGWNATVTQSGAAVTARAPAWATSLAPGQSWTVGYQGSGPSTPSPTGFALQGSACT